MEMTVQRGQSLSSIAKSRLPAGASEAQIRSAANQIADANGLAHDAQLQIGQKIEVPNEFVGSVARDQTTSDAVARLSRPSNPAQSGLQARLPKRPLLDFSIQFAPTKREAVGTVALPDIAGVPVKATVEKFLGMQTMLGEEALKTLDARFGKLSQSQFDAVHKEFGGRSQVKFDAAREYTAIDFLPPMLQALVNKDLEIPASIKLKGTKNIGEINMDPSDHSIDLTMNCHATAWEAARAFQGVSDKVSIFYGEMITADALHDDTKFKQLGVVENADRKRVLEMNLKPGDIVQFEEVADWQRMTMLVHTAVYVGGGMFFEKPNTEGPEKPDPANYVTQEETPYRLCTLDMMCAPLDAAFEGKFKLELYRPTAPIDEAAKVWESSLEGDFKKYAEKKGTTLGIELVSMLEQGMGGNIRGEHASGLVSIRLKQGDDGRGALDL